MSQTVKETIQDELKEGIKELRMMHTVGKGKNVPLEDVPADWKEFLKSEAHLYSFEQHMEKTLLFQYVDEMIQLLPELKASGDMDSKLLAVWETLLLAMDKLSHHRLTNEVFPSELDEELQNIFAEFNQVEKTFSFSTDSNRPVLNKGEIIEEEGKLYAIDKREQRRPIYMAVVFSETGNKKEEMTQLGKVILKIGDLSQNSERVEYEDYCRGMRNVELHERTIFYINLVKRVMNWLVNSMSWRCNELTPFDEMDVASKLGVYR